MNAIESRGLLGLFGRIFLFSVLLAAAESISLMLRGADAASVLLPASLLSAVLFFGLLSIVALPVLLVSRLRPVSLTTGTALVLTGAVVLITVLTAEMSEPRLFGIRAYAGPGAILVPAGIGVICLLVTSLLLRTRSRHPVSGILLTAGVLILATVWISWLTGPFGAGETTPEKKAAEVTPRGPNLILIVIDTLRQDRLGCYGNPDELTPNIDRFRDDGILFENAIVPCPRTAQSVSTMMTGLFPPEHGVRRIFNRLDDRFLTLAEVLRGRGYRTLGVVSNPILRRDHSGLAQGFEKYDDAFLSRRYKRLLLIRLFENYVTRIRLRDLHASITTDRVIDMIENRRGDSPFFLWVQYFDPHWLYLPPEEFRNVDPDIMTAITNIYDSFDAGAISMGDIAFHTDWSPRQADAFRHLYDGEVRYCDREIGRLFDYLHERGLYDKSVIVVTSDHGEGLGDHSYYFIHGLYLFDEEVRVPLLIKPQAGEHSSLRTCSQLVTTADLMANLIDLMGGEQADRQDDRLWFESTDGTLTLKTGDTREYVYGESDIPMNAEDVPEERNSGRLRMIRSRDRKLIVNRKAGGDEKFSLFDIENDPGEENNIYDEDPAEAQILLNYLKKLYTVMKNDQTEQPEEIDKNLLDDLQALGYVR